MRLALLGGEPLERRPRRGDPAGRGPQIGASLVGLQPRELLAQRDAITFVDEDLAHAPHQIEPELRFAVALDRAAAERLLHHLAGLDPVCPCRDWRERAHVDHRADQPDDDDRRDQRAATAAEPTSTAGSRRRRRR